METLEYELIQVCEKTTSENMNVLFNDFIRDKDHSLLCLVKRYVQN